LPAMEQMQQLQGHGQKADEQKEHEQKEDSH
jgi:hypothetical protein